ncbi:hypothetical protein GYMLUDRAFT_205402 [Collybiopsis luxurians FD-317 M1]|uniref:Solute carrier family 40 member n=1 Tax=Collybiopsis luxurians FD-317 M1 TaxID=944289 RepID=A0A0D0BLB4_9AGAR|nr:hypothetical protein GYMLUDRAFT_205402 [Collybiopsis luxurians FD-317 M1]
MMQTALRFLGRGSSTSHGFDSTGLRCLLVQHFSSAWGDRTAEFALYLYLIKYFKDTLLPSSILGFAMTLSGIALSHWAGSLVDRYKHERLRLVRAGILVQKFSALVAYVCCAWMLSGVNSPPEPASSQGQAEHDSMTPSSSSWTTSLNFSFMTPLFAMIVLSGCTLNLSNTCISIAVERDWATSISTSVSDLDGEPEQNQRQGQGQEQSRDSEEESVADNDSTTSVSFEDKLSKLNTYLRQINLLCQLCAPLFVSFLTVTYDGREDGAGTTVRKGGDSTVSLSILSAITVLALAFEMYWIGVVYKRFPQLQWNQGLDLDQGHDHGFHDLHQEQEDQWPTTTTGSGIQAEENERQMEVEVEFDTPNESTAFLGSGSPGSTNSWWQRLKLLIVAHEWEELAHLPVFFSSLSISLLYITVLSFDGIMIGYLNMLSFSDDLIAKMRGLCVITGLCGTALSHPLERKIGTVRAGSWSIWSMVFSLAPVLFAFYVFAPQSESPSGSPGHPAMGVLGAALIFGGMALSRIGLWSFDLIQTKQLQTALNTHPRRNSLTALQYTMHNLASLVKFTLTMIFWRPSQFHWAATASFASVSTGAVVYMVYVKKTRGHVMHLDWMKKIF